MPQRFSFTYLGSGDSKPWSALLQEQRGICPPLPLLIGVRSWPSPSPEGRMGGIGLQADGSPCSQKSVYMGEPHPSWGFLLGSLRLGFLQPNCMGEEVGAILLCFC